MAITSYNLELTVQLDTAVFPASSTVDITSSVISVDIDLGVDQDNGSCSVHLTSMPAAAAFGVRLYVYAGFSGTALIFNGFIDNGGMRWNADHTATLICVDAMSRLRVGWSKDDRTYTNVTAQSVAQNLAEASGTDASLTHIEGTGRLIGVVQDVVLHGGTEDPLTGDPGPCDVPLDLIRKIDESEPLYVTYSAGNGAIYRRPWELDAPVAELADGPGGNAWDLEHTLTLAETFNACKVIGLPIAGIPTTAISQVAISEVPDPPKYRTRQVNNSLIEDVIQAQTVADAYVDYDSVPFHLLSVTTHLRNDIDPADTVLIASHASGNEYDALVQHIHHHIDGKTATTAIQAKHGI